MEKMSWTLDLPCKNPKVKRKEEAADFDRKDFIERQERFGTMFFSKKGSMFSECYFEPNEAYKGRRVCDVPVNVNIELTGKCNLTCKHCYAAPFSTHSELHLTQLDALFMESQLLHVVGVTFLGGEPFLYSQVENVCDRAKKRNLKVQLCTNGYEIPEEKLLAVAKNTDCLWVSVDGDRETHDFLREKEGSYDSALDTLSKLQSNDFYSGVIMTVNRFNRGQIRHVYEEAKKRGADEFLLKRMTVADPRHPMYDSRISKDDPLFTSADGENSDFTSWYIGRGGCFSIFGCPGGTFDLTISEDGSAYRCVRHQKTDASLGSLKRDRLSDIWRRNLETLEPCKEGCEYAKFCGGPCRLTEYSKS